MGGAENNARAERYMIIEAIINWWWINQMSVVRQRSEQLRKEISSEGSTEGSTEGRLHELRKLQRQGELASSWLRERGLL